jgi:hypothetical protein
MPDWNLVTRQHVLAAIVECDQLGSREFLQRYHFGRAPAYTLWHGGQEYDSKAILGVAYLHATGRAATSDEFSGGKDGAAKVLAERGFDIVVDEELAAQEAPRRAAAARSRRSVAEPQVKICPRCFMALPATGVCNNCD